MENNSLAKTYTFGSLIKFSLPTIIMMVFMSLYTMVDGVFVSQVLDLNALAAVNIIYPIVGIVVAIGIMLATGGSAIIAKKLGEKKPEEARQNFTLIVIVGLVIGALITTLGIIFINPLIKALGASPAIHQYCFDYAFPLIFFVPCGILMLLFQSFFVVAGKPAIGMIATITGGVLNIVLDYVFLVPAQMGISGAALATGIGYSVPALFGLIYFIFNRKGTLYFVKPKFDFKMVLNTCANGSSEMVTNLSTAVTTLLFNIIMMKYLGEDGVAAITIVLYVQYLLTAIHLGYSNGVAPVVSYKLGHNDESQLRKIFRCSLIFIAISTAVTFALALICAKPITLFFASGNRPVYDIALPGSKIFAISYLFIGINIFASAFFTALGNGKVSALISFLRTFVFFVLCLILLPMLLSPLGLSAAVVGIWAAVPLAEILGLIVSIVILVIKRKKYNYAGKQTATL